MPASKTTTATPVDSTVQEAIAAAVGRLPTTEIQASLNGAGAEQNARQAKIREIEDQLDDIKEQREHLSTLALIDPPAAAAKATQLNAKRDELSDLLDRLKGAIAATKDTIDLYAAELELREVMTRRAAHGLMRQAFPHVLATHDGPRYFLTKEGNQVLQELAKLVAGEALARASVTGFLPAPTQDGNLPSGITEVLSRARKLMEDAWTKNLAEATTRVEKARVDGGKVE